MQDRPRVVDQHGWFEFDEVAEPSDSVTRSDDDTRIQRLMEQIFVTLDQGVSLQADFRVQRDESGEFVVSDPFGAAIGTGDTKAAAVADWEVAGREALEDIEAFAGGLHPRIARQREYLRSVLD